MNTRNFNISRIVIYIKNFFNRKALLSYIAIYIQKNKIKPLFSKLFLSVIILVYINKSTYFKLLFCFKKVFTILNGLIIMKLKLLPIKTLLSKGKTFELKKYLKLYLKLYKYYSAI